MGIYTCPREGCQAAYTKKSELEEHERSHNGERPFVCDESGCSKAYTRKQHLKRHKHVYHKQKHTSLPLMCSEKGCGRILSNRYALKKHCKQMHNTENYAFICAHCSQGFQRKRQLKRHLYLHTGEVPFKCSTCNIGFTAMHQYNKHMRYHRTFTCDCGEPFERWTLLLAHKKTSSNSECNPKPEYKCIICKKTFATQSILTQHSLVHLDESQKETYRCPYIDCKRSYQYKRNLNYHIVVFHEKLNDPPQIPCTEPNCGQILRSKKNLKQHMLAMHSNIPKEKKPRRPRKDKGKPKKCMASFLSGVQLPIKEHSTILNNANLKSDKVSENMPECSDAIGINVVVIDEQPLSQNGDQASTNQNGSDQQSNVMFMSQNINTSDLSSDDLNNKLEMVAAQN